MDEGRTTEWLRPLSIISSIAAAASFSLCCCESLFMLVAVEDLERGATVATASSPSTIILMEVEGVGGRKERLKMERAREAEDKG